MQRWSAPKWLPEVLERKARAHTCGVDRHGVAPCTGAPHAEGSHVDGVALPGLQLHQGLARWDAHNRPGHRRGASVTGWGVRWAARPQHIPFKAGILNSPSHPQPPAYTAGGFPPPGLLSSFRCYSSCLWPSALGAPQPESPAPTLGLGLPLCPQLSDGSEPLRGWGLSAACLSPALGL